MITQPRILTRAEVEQSRSYCHEGRAFYDDSRIVAVHDTALALEGALRELLDNLSLHGCCPANNCASEDVSGLGGLRDPEPHSDGCAYVAASDLITKETR